MSKFLCKGSAILLYISLAQAWTKIICIPGKFYVCLFNVYTLWVMDNHNYILTTSDRGLAMTIYQRLDGSVTGGLMSGYRHYRDHLSHYGRVCTLLEHYSSIL